MVLPLGETIGVVAFVVIAVIVSVIKSWRNGWIRQALEDREEAQKAHQTVNGINGKMDDVYEEVHETKEQVDDIEDRVEDLQGTVNEGFRTLAVIHKDDEDVRETELRDRLGVEELDDDVLGGS